MTPAALIPASSVGSVIGAGVFQPAQSGLPALDASKWVTALWMSFASIIRQPKPHSWGGL